MAVIRGLSSMLIALLALGVAAACGNNPPQIVEYSPERGTTDVSTSIPIRITFDRDVDKASVASRLHTDPASKGRIVWLNNRTLEYDHETLSTSTVYQVILEAGYRAAAGDVYQLRHHWQFTTEAPPSLQSSIPASAERDVDPSAYVNLEFSRTMDAASVLSATSIVPAVPFALRVDPNDQRRLIVAPGALLRPDADYTVTVTTAALDIDGNPLDHAQTFTFTTGAIRPLRHWVGFVAVDQGGNSTGLWMVDESRFPRQLFNDSPVDSFSWSPDGQRVMLHRTDGGWTDLTVGGIAVQLDLEAIWAAQLAPGLGYAYLDATGTLRHQALGGGDTLISAGVVEASVSPRGDRLAYLVPAGQQTEIWGYDVGLHASYRLAREPGAVSNLAWAPTGNRLAYLLQTEVSSSLRVLTLGGTSSKTTLVTGDLGPPAWLPDSVHLVLSASIQGAAGSTRRAFVLNASSPPTSLSLGIALPAAGDFDVVNPVPSPDGHQIAFVNQASGYAELWLMNADGTDPEALTRFDDQSFPYSAVSPAWTRT